jgi:transposase
MLFFIGEERETLDRWAGRSPPTAQTLAQRARIVLKCATGEANQMVPRDVGVARLTVRRWHHRSVTKRLDGLVDEARPGALRKITNSEWRVRLKKEAAACSISFRMGPGTGPD